MPAKPTTVKAYVDSLPADRRKGIRAVRTAVNRALPKGYKEGIQYGVIGWFVPHSIYPDGYHCSPDQPLPFAGLASQKQYMSLYLMCIYGDAKHRSWFEKEWKKTGKKLDMGKSCIRFKKLDDLALDVIAKVIKRTSAKRHVAMYEAAFGEKGRPKKTVAKKKRKTVAKKKTTAKKTTAGRKRVS